MSESESETDEFYFNIQDEAIDGALKIILGINLVFRNPLSI